MSYTNLQVANMALAHLGVGSAASLSDNSEKVDQINAFIEITREQTLRDFPWPFATKTLDSTDVTTAATNTFALVASEPNYEWAYAYRYPTDCLEIRRIQSGIRNDTPVSRVPFRVGFDGTTTTATGRLIFTDMEDAILEYTALVTDNTIYPPDFVMAWSYRLAWHIAPALVASFTPATVQNLMQLYAIQLDRARANSANEEQQDRYPEAEWTSGR